MMGGYGAMGFGGIWMIVLWIVIIAGVALAARYFVGAGAPGNAGASPTPLDLLRERYARGEIGKEEFERIRRDLGAR